MESEYILKPPILDSLINLVGERIPKWIACDNWKTVSLVLSETHQLLEKTKQKLKNENEENFQNSFLESLENIAKKVEINSLPELIPFVHDLRSMKKNYLGLAVEHYERILKENNISIEEAKESTKSIRFKFFKKMISSFLGETSKVDTFTKENNLSQSSLSLDIWEYVAKEKLKKLKEDFNFKSVMAIGNTNWSEVYVWANDSYKAIEEAQAAIGLDKRSAGLNGEINLVFNPSHLKEIGANGSVYVEKIDLIYNTIFLNNFDKESQKAIWQHEYAHAIDNKLGIEYLKSIGKKDINLNSFFTQIELENQLNKNSKNISPDKNIAKAQIWASEAISCILSGKNIEELVEKNSLKKREFTKKISESFLKQFLTDDVFNSVDEKKKEKLINDSEINFFTNLWVERIYLFKEVNPVASILSPKNGYDEIFSDSFKKLHSRLKNLTKNEINFENYTEKLKNNEKAISKIFREIILNESYAHTNLTPYFAFSDSSIASAWKSAADNNPYWTRPLEIFARACENLQKPLFASSFDYFAEKNSKKSPSEYINPELNLTERKIFIETLHAMLNVLGIQPDLNITATALNKNLVKDDGSIIENMNDFIGNETNSSNSVNELASKTVYNIAKIREKGLLEKKLFKIN